MPAYGSPNDPNLSNRPPHEEWPAFTPPSEALADQYAAQPGYYPQPVPQPAPPQQPVYVPQFQQVGPAQPLPPAPRQPIANSQVDVETVANAVNAKMKRLGDLEALRFELAHAINDADLANRRVAKLARMLATYDEEPAQQSSVQQGPIAGQYVEPVYQQPAVQRQPESPPPAMLPKDESQISTSHLPGLHQNVVSALLKHGVRSVADVRAAIQRMATTKEKIPGIGPAYAKAMDAAIRRWDKERR